MVKKLLLTGLVGASMMGVVGCGGSGSDDNTIVGTWYKACHNLTDDPSARYRTEKIVVNEDGNFTYEKVKYDDDKCTENPDKQTVNAIYKTGGTAEADDGKLAYEIDFDLDYLDYYSMYRFLDNGNLVLADGSEEKDGLSSESRRDHFDPDWTGYTRQ